MTSYTLGAIETRFAELIWENEPVPSGSLVKLAERELNWKKSTTYTILRRLCQRGLFQNENGLVTSLISMQDFRAAQSQQFVDDAFHGSLPKFLTAFAGRKKLSQDELDSLQRLIDENRG